MTSPIRANASPSTLSSPLELAASDELDSLSEKLPEGEACASGCAETGGWEGFRDEFLATPRTALEQLRGKAIDLGRQDLVAPLSGLQIEDGGNHSIASNVLRNYPIHDIYNTLNP